MIEVPVRLLSAFLLHPEHGVNELAQSFPRTRLDGTLDDLPPEVGVENDADSESVAKDLTPSKTPGLVVWGDSSVEVRLPKVHLVARNVAIAIGYVTNDSVNSVQAVRDCGYILRGVVLSLRRYNSQEKSAGYRELNGIKVLELTKIEEQLVTASVGSFKLWGFVGVQATVVETLQ